MEDGGKHSASILHPRSSILLPSKQRAGAEAGVPRRPAIDRFHFERELWRQGIDLVAGVDEVGRGPLAGPVTVAAVMLPAAWDQTGLPAELAGLNDSKQLSATQREAFYGALTTLPGIHYALAECHAGEIDEINILQATHRAMNAALAQLTPAPAHVLVDGARVPTLKLPHTAIVKGDGLSYSIAAASVLAKVTRDRQMVAYHLRWPQYGFATHKGYGTPAHLAALAQHGPCPIHRWSFAPVKSLPIANCQLPIGDWKLAIGNGQ